MTKFDPMNDMQNYVQGYVLIPVLLAAKKASIFAHLQKGPVSSAELADLCGAKDGILQVLLQELQSLRVVVRSDSGEFEPNKGSELLDQLEHIPEDILETYDIDMQEYMGKDGVDCYQVWIQMVESMSDQRNLLVNKYLEGVIMVPLLVRLAQAVQKLKATDWIDVSQFSNRFLDNISLIFGLKKWGVLESKEGVRVLKLTRTGQWVLDRALSYGVASCYQKLLFHLSDLLLGSGSNGIKNHVDRVLHVQGFAAMHKCIYEATINQIGSLFRGQDFGDQPAYLVDAGCGDGSLLARAYKAIKDSARGENFDEWPLKVVGIDCDKATLNETAKTMKREKIPYLLTLGNVGEPLKIRENLQEQGVDLSKVVHVRTFLDHDRPFAQPLKAYCFSPTRYCGTFTTPEGQVISPQDFLQNLDDHFKQWASAIELGGHLIALELHCLDPEESCKYRNESISIYLDPILLTSGQLPTTVRQYHLAAAANGLFPAADPSSLTLFPKNKEFHRVSLTDFQRQNIRVDYLVKHDIDDLYGKLLNGKSIPKPVWSRLVETFPEGQLLYMDQDEVLRGVLTATSKEIQAIPELAELFGAQDPETAIVIPLEYSNKKMVPEYLLSFDWLQALLLPGVQKVKVYRASGQGKADPLLWDFVRHRTIVDATWDISEFWIPVEQAAAAVKAPEQRSFMDIILQELRKLLPNYDGEVVDVSVLELGLSSLDMMYLARQLQSLGKVQVPSTVFFAYPTPRALAGYLDSLAGNGPLSKVVNVPVKVVNSPLKAVNGPAKVINNPVKVVNGPLSKTVSFNGTASRPVKEETLYELSYNQEQLWLWFKIFGTKVGPYNIPRIEFLEGKINQSAFEGAFREVLRRHKTLRTRFLERNGVPMQRVVEMDPQCLPIVWKDFSNEVINFEQVSSHIQEDINRPFDLLNESPIRVLGIALPDNINILAITTHHIVTDGSSLPNFWNELTMLYESLVTATPVALPGLPWDYFQWVKWHKQSITAEVRAREVDYWKKTLDEGNVPYLRLPADFPYPDLSECPGHRVMVHLSPEVTSQIKRMCTKEGATLFMGMTSAWYLLLMRLSGQHDFAIGTTWANRSRTEIENSIGCFINTIPLRIKSDDKMTFSDLLAEVKKVAQGAYSHANVPIHKIIEGFKFQRSATQYPIMQTMMLMPEKGGWVKGDPLHGTSRKSMPQIKAKRLTSKLEISLSVGEISTESGTAIEGKLVCNALLFTYETAQRITRQFESLMASIVQAGPSAPIQEIPINDDQSSKTLWQWSNIGRDVEFPKDSTIFDLFRARAESTPSAIAIKCKSELWTYEQLLNMALNVGKGLSDGNIRNERIGLYLGRSPYIIASTLGVMASGNTYVPMDIKYPTKRLEFIRKNADVKCFITDQPEASWMKGSTVFQTSEFPTGSTEWASPKVPVDVTAYIIHTSGSTGEPKGVMVGHESLTNYISFMATKQIGEEYLRQTLFSTNLCFDQSILEMYAPLVTGNTVIVAEGILDLEWSNQGATFAVTTPSAIQLLCHCGIPSSLKALLLGGEDLNAELAGKLFKESNVQVIYNGYGPTEGTCHTSVSAIRREDPLTMIHAGRPVDNTTALLLDQRLNLSPLGAWGELAVGGKCVAQGYVNRVDLTEKAFIQNPFGPGKLYRTGDYFRWTSDGFLKFKGRIDDQIKIQGTRIEIGEIENSIRSLAKVENCCVKIRSDKFGGKQIVAYVLGSGLTEEGVRQHCEAILPVYMIPRRVIFVDEFKLGPSGKIDGFALPDVSQQSQGPAVEKPSNFEFQVINLFKEILELDRVLPNGDFFSLGGHSVLTIMVIEKVKDLFGVDISMKDFIANSTARKLANFISGKSTKSPSPTVEVGFNQIPEGGKNVLIIGAGIAGIMAAIELKGRGIRFTIVEQSSDIGGIWLSGCNKKSRLQTPSAHYRVDKWIKHKYLHPNRQQMLEYLNQIVSFHHLRKHIMFATKVLNVRDNGRGFHIQVRSGTTERVLTHDGILVCVGKHQKPFIPQWPVTSDSAPQVVHASKLDGVDFRGKRVTVVGAGSYAVEAVQMASMEGAERVDMVARGFHWIIPSFADTIIHSGIDFESMSLRSDYEQMSKTLIGHLKSFYAQYNLEEIIPRPENQPFDANLSVSNEFFQLFPKHSIEFFESQISELRSNSVILENGICLSSDIVVAATGYQDPEFPFLQGICNNPLVYKGFMLAQDPRIGFAGLLDMVGSATAVLPININAALAVMRDRQSRPSEAEVAQWLDLMPIKMIKNVKSHVSWIVDMQFPNESATGNSYNILDVRKETFAHHEQVRRLSTK